MVVVGFSASRHVRIKRCQCTLTLVTHTCRKHFNLVLVGIHASSDLNSRLMSQLITDSEYDLNINAYSEYDLNFNDLILAAAKCTKYFKCGLNEGRC